MAIDSQTLFEGIQSAGGGKTMTWYSSSSKDKPTRFSKIKDMDVVALSETLAGKSFKDADDAFVWLISSYEEEK